MPPRRKPEIMSPAGHWPQMHAAIEAGADAVYFGLNHFSARAKVGFSLAELPEAMRTLHKRGVRGYITFNTLIFEHELAEAARTIAAIAEAGADALIMQDYGARENGSRNRARDGTARQHADEHHQCRRCAICASGRPAARDAGARAFARRGPHHHRKPPAAISKSSCTARCASPTRDSAFRPKLGADAARIAASARRRADCRI